MTDKQILMAQADAMTEAPVHLKIHLIHPSWWQRQLIKWGKLKPYREFTLKPLVLTKLVQISKVLLGMDTDVLVVKDNALETSYKLIVNHSKDMAVIGAIMLTPGVEGYSQDLADFLHDNLSARELDKLSGIALKQMEVGNFISSIITMKGMNVLVQSERNVPENEVSQS